MSETIWLLIALVVLSVIVLLIFGKRLGRFRVKILQAELEAESRKPSSGASTKRVSAGRNINVMSNGGGPATAEDSKARHDINVTHIGRKR